MEEENSADSGKNFQSKSRNKKTSGCHHTALWIAVAVNSIVVILIGATTLLHVRQNEKDIHQLRTKQIQLTTALRVSELNMIFFKYQFLSTQVTCSNSKLHQVHHDFACSQFLLSLSINV